jgi:hypothetical protein
LRNALACYSTKVSSVPHKRTLSPSLQRKVHEITNKSLNGHRSNICTSSFVQADPSTMHTSIHITPRFTPRQQTYFSAVHPLFERITEYVSSGACSRSEQRCGSERLTGPRCFHEGPECSKPRPPRLGPLFLGENAGSRALNNGGSCCKSLADWPWEVCEHVCGE